MAVGTRFGGSAWTTLASIPAPAAGVTFGSWFRFESAAAVAAFTFGAGPDYASYWIGREGGNVFVYDVTANAQLGASFAVSVNTWVYIVLRWTSATSMSLGYITTPGGSITWVVTNLTVTSRTWAGFNIAGDPAFSEHFVGTAEYFTIFASALSDAAISANSNSDNPAGAWVSYKLEGGVAATDSSGNGRTATVTGTPTTSDVGVTLVGGATYQASFDPLVMTATLSDLTGVWSGAPDDTFVQFSQITNRTVLPGRQDKVSFIDLSGDWCYFVRNVTTSRTVLHVSADYGATWTELTIAADTLATCPDSVCQTSDGAVHVVVGGSFQGLYHRIALTRSGGHVTGWSVVASIAYPKSGGFPESASMRVVRDGNNAERLFFSAVTFETPRQWDLFCTHGIAPASASDFFSLTGTANAVTQVTLPHQSVFGNESCTTFEQHPISGSLYAFLGPASSETVWTTDLPYGYVKIDQNGENWTANTPVEVALSTTTYAQVLSNSCVTDTKILILVHRGSLGLVIDEIDETGTYVTNAISVAATASGRYACGALVASADGQTLWATWIQDWAYSPGNGVGTVNLGIYRGTWTIVTDTSGLFTTINLPGFVRCDYTLATSGQVGLVSFYQDSWDLNNSARARIVSTVGPLATYSAAFDPIACPVVLSALTVVWSGRPPIVVAFGATESGTTNQTSFAAPIGSPSAGVRVVLIVSKDGSADFATTPAGWTVASNTAQGTAIRSIAIWKNCNGTEGATVSFTTSTAESFVGRYYQIEAGSFDPDTAPAIAVNAVATANNNPAAISPLWGAAANLYLCTLAQDTNSAAPTYPSGYTLGQGTLRSSNSTTGDRTRLSGCYKIASSASEDPPAWTSAAVASVAYTIAIRPALPAATQYQQSCVAAPVTTTVTRLLQARKTWQILPVSVTTVARQTRAVRGLTATIATTVRKSDRARRLVIATLAVSGARKSSKTPRSTTATTTTTPRRTSARRGVVESIMTQLKSRVANRLGTVTTGVMTRVRRTLATRTPVATSTTTVGSRVMLGLIVQPVAITIRGYVTTGRYVRIARDRFVTGTAIGIRRAQKRSSVVVSLVSSVLTQYVSGLRKLTFSVVTTSTTTARRMARLPRGAVPVGATVSRLVRDVGVVRVETVISSVSRIVRLGAYREVFGTLETTVDVIRVQLFYIAVSAATGTVALRRRVGAKRLGQSGASVVIGRQLRTSRTILASLGLLVARRARLRTVAVLPGVLFATRASARMTPVLAATVTSSLVGIRRDLRARRVSVATLVQRVRKAVTGTHVPVGVLSLWLRKRPTKTATTEVVATLARATRRARVWSRTVSTSTVAFLADRLVAQIYPLSAGARHLANLWRGKLIHRAIPMEKYWTTLLKRTNEILDIAVDWEKTCRDLGEVDVVSVTWTIDSQYPGDAVLAGVPYQPRLEGFVAKARVIVGNTTDTMFCCRATFRSGATAVDKTLVKWIP